MVCYPAHTTHVLQGLDVVVFAILKRCLSEERDRWERETGEAVSKANFLTIYGRAHLRALTPATIVSAFRKTGIHPFNRDVIPKEAMAPSKETSGESQLPSVVAPEIQVLAKMLQDLTVGQDTSDEAMSSAVGLSEMERTGETVIENHTREGNRTGDVVTMGAPPHTSPLAPIAGLSAKDPQSALQTVVSDLRNGALAYLVLSNPATSTDNSPPTTSQPIPVVPTAYSDLIPVTNIEKALLIALRESEAREADLRRRLNEAQASNILNELYCSKLRRQLAYSEEKRAKKQKGKGRLMGDGLPCLLSGDAFYEKVVDFETLQREEERRKEAKRQEKEDMAESLAAWKKDETARKSRNEAKRERYREAVKVWEAERDVARQSKTAFRKLKPRQETLEKAAPRPKPVAVVEESSDGDGDDDDDDDE